MVTAYFGEFMSLRIRIFLRFGLLFTYAGIIVWLSLTTHPPRVSVHWFSWDKAQHALAYFLLTLFAGRAFVLLFPSRRKAWFLAFFFALVFGSLLELAQGAFSRARWADGYDILANGCGALVIYLLASLSTWIAGEPVKNVASSAGGKKTQP
jgi:VanZ family protein